MIIITYQPLPHNIPSLIHENDDCSYTIIVNQHLSDQAKKDAVIHELRHLKRGDLGAEGQDVNKIELDCHQMDGRKFEISDNQEIYIKDGE